MYGNCTQDLRYTALCVQWEVRRNDGEGYEVGCHYLEPEEAARFKGWKTLYQRDSTDDVLICRKRDGTLVGIADVWGPWAIDLEEVANE